MDNTWVKLYRKIGNNEVLFDNACLRTFIWLLANVDKKTGSVTTGRFQLASNLRLNPNTVYKALKRLEKVYKIVTQSSNNRFTTISLLNWAKYQAPSEKVTQAGNTPGNTKQEYIKLNNTNTIPSLVNGKSSKKENSVLEEKTTPPTSEAGWTIDPNYSIKVGDPGYDPKKDPNSYTNTGELTAKQKHDLLEYARELSIKHAPKGWYGDN